MTWKKSFWNDNVWFGEAEEPVFVDEHEGYYELEHEEDYQGIADQLLAEELYDI